MKVHLIKKSLVIALPFIIAISAFCDSVYEVKKGDTLYSISKKYELTVEEIKAANNLSDNSIKFGQKLIIPDADIGNAAALSSNKVSNNSSSINVKTSDYVVQKGETLYRIAKNNNISVAELMALNNLDSNDVLKAGQVLKIKAEPNVQEKENTQTANKEKVPEVKVTEKAPDTRNYGNVVKYDSSIRWPVDNPTVTQVKGKIEGVQLSAKSKENVICIHEGTVMFVGTYRGYGQVLFVQSKTGLIYAYTGLGSIKVKKGEYVLAGDKIGTAGVDPLTGKPQITFMVFQNGNPIDPSKAPRSF